MCDEGACHAGQCRVLSQGLGILCDCPFGYLASDHCQTPWVIIGIVAFFLLVGCIVIITLVARRSRKLTYQVRPKHTQPHTQNIIIITHSQDIIIYIFFSSALFV